MAKIKLTKTELKAQTDALKRFQRFLPMLQLKKQQLQGEIAGIVAKADAVSAREREVRARLDSWVALFATAGGDLEGLVSVKQIRTSQANIAGVEIPVFDGIDTDVKPIDLWATPAWTDDAVAAWTSILSLQSERVVLEEQKRRIAEELRTFFGTESIISRNAGQEFLVLIKNRKTYRKGRGLTEAFRLILA